MASLVGGPDSVGADDSEAPSARLVLAVYTAVMASSRSERAAFDAAVETYRAENPHGSEAEARVAVARIICWKPL